MTSVTLRASGYTWKCAECGRENYTGPAPGSVRCGQCHAEFEVKALQHRRAESVDLKRKEVKTPEQAPLMPLFAESRPMAAEDEIPF